MRTRFAKAQPTVSEVHVNRPLTDTSVGFMQADTDFVAARVFPIVPVAKQSDLYYVYSREDFYRSTARKRAPGTESAGSGYTLSTDSYFADKYAIHKDVSDDVVSNSDSALRPEQDATTYVTQQLMLIREITWMADYFVTGVWTGGSGGGETTPGVLWSASGSDPIGDITAEVVNIKGATGYLPNTIVASPRVHNILANHPDVLDRIKYTQEAVVTEQLLARLFGVQRYMIAWGVQNTAAEGATEATDFIAGDNLLLCHSAPQPSLMTPSAGYTFAWTGLLGAGAFANRMKRFRMEHLESWRIEGEIAFDTKQVASDLGHLFLQPIA